MSYTSFVNKICLDWNLELKSFLFGIFQSFPNWQAYVFVPTTMKAHLWIPTCHSSQSGAHPKRPVLLFQCLKYVYTTFYTTFNLREIVRQKPLNCFWQILALFLKLHLNILWYNIFISRKKIDQTLLKPSFW